MCEAKTDVVRERERERKGAAEIALPLEFKPMLIRFSFSSLSQELELP